MKKDIIPLSDLHPGEEAAIVNLAGCAGCAGRLAALGFTPGATLRVMRNSGHGPILVSLLDTQIALGRGQAKGIQVHRATERQQVSPLAAVRGR
jgi:ferrous iron transport protein A